MNVARMSRLFSLEGQTALVTGGGAGIGRAIAELLAAAGAGVVVSDCNPETGADTVSGILDQGGKADFLEMDIGKPSSVDDTFSELCRREGGLDILVNNAAVFPKYPTLEITPAQWDNLHAVTLRGTMLVSQAAVRLMKEQGRGGRIVNISSCSSLQTLVHSNVAYGAAKAGVNMLTKTYALEFAPDQINVNAVLPGGVKTAGAKQVQQSLKISGPITGQNRIPLGRAAEPDDIAAAVLYLVSPAAAYVTGQLLAVDGGFMIS